jgi:hypothetical protein
MEQTVVMKTRLSVAIDPRLSNLAHKMKIR